MATFLLLINMQRKQRKADPALIKHLRTSHKNFICSACKTLTPCSQCLNDKIKRVPLETWFALRARFHKVNFFWTIRKYQRTIFCRKVSFGTLFALIVSSISLGDISFAMQMIVDQNISGSIFSFCPLFTPKIEKNSAHNRHFNRLSCRLKSLFSFWTRISGKSEK